MIQRAVGIGLVVLFGSALAGCHDGSELVGSCRAPTLDDGSKICVDASRDGEKLSQNLCRLMRGDWNDGRTCDRSEAIAGCKQDNGSILWSYPSRKVSNVDDVRGICKGETILVDSDT